MYVAYDADHRVRVVGLLLSSVVRIVEEQVNPGCHEAIGFDNGLFRLPTPCGMYTIEKVQEYQWIP